jgi:hypothetical protein
MSKEQSMDRICKCIRIIFRETHGIKKRKHVCTKQTFGKKFKV